MIKNRLLILFSGILLYTSLSGCKKQDADAGPEPNPFSIDMAWNGFVFDTTRYHTPRAYLENWGENLDSLSADYDIKFTDGTYDAMLHDVSDYSILVYFDANSPSLNELSDGLYTVENTPVRKPGNIVEAWVEISNEGKIYKFKVTEGTVSVRRESGNVLIAYDAVLDNTHHVKGQYTGEIVPILQVLEK